MSFFGGMIRQMFNAMMALGLGDYPVVAVFAMLATEEIHDPGVKDANFDSLCPEVTSANMITGKYLSRLDQIVVIDGDAYHCIDVPKRSGYQYLSLAFKATTEFPCDIITSNMTMYGVDHTLILTFTQSVQIRVKCSQISSVGFFLRYSTTPPANYNGVLKNLRSGMMPTNTYYTSDYTATPQGAINLEGEMVDGSSQICVFKFRTPGVITRYRFVVPDGWANVQLELTDDEVTFEVAGIHMSGCALPIILPVPGKHGARGVSAIVHDYYQQHRSLVMVMRWV